MSRTLIAFETKMGMSKRSAEIINKFLQEKYQIVTDIIDLKHEKVRIEGYQNIIIGSGIIMGKWLNQAKKFLKNDFTGKQVFVFICSMSATKAKEEDNTEELQMKIKQYLDDVIVKNPSLKPLSKVIFGGKKKSKGDLKRENWKEEDVTKWADEISQIIKN